MRRKGPTGRFAAVSDAPVRLVVEYESADDFLADYAENLSRLEGFVQTERVVPAGTQVVLGLEFAGLREPIVLGAIVQPPSGEGWTRVQLLPPAPARLGAIAEHIRNRDPRVVTPVVRVLLAEDNAHVCELVKTGLSAATRRELRDVAFGFEIALDGAAALSILERTTLDAAIVDIYLPVLDGAALIRRIRTTSPRLPVIAISGGGDSARDAAMRAGASTYLDKPIRLRTIVDALRQLITV